MISILISTKNRKTELEFTLERISDLLVINYVECIIYDDGSDDGTFDFIKNSYPKIKIHRNEISKGYLFCRNKMLNETKSDFAISLDDDAHFLLPNSIKTIQNFFDKNPKCGLIAFRLFWNKSNPISTETSDESVRVKGFVGCAHVWRMKAWRDIPNYPEWFVFYGEEDFASYHLFKKKWEINYLPEILVNHRVDVKSRKNDADYRVRLRRSLRTGWYLFFLFYPIRIIPRKMVYSIWLQLKLKVFQGEFKALQAIILALLDVVLAIPNIIKNSDRLSHKEYDAYQKLESTKIFWQPENTQDIK